MRVGLPRRLLALLVVLAAWAHEDADWHAGKVELAPNRVHKLPPCALCEVVRAREGRKCRRPRLDLESSRRNMVGIFDTLVHLQIHWLLERGCAGKPHTSAVEPAHVPS